MTFIRFAFVGFLFATVCQADQFFLKDAKGKQYGPFEVRQGVKVQAGGQDFEVVKITTPRDAVIQAMQRIVLPEVEFKQASIDDVVTFLAKASRENDPEKQGVNVMLIPWIASTNEPGMKQLMTNVTLSARNVRLYSLIKTLRQVTGLTVHVDATGVKFMAPEEPDGAILHRAYPVEPTYIERVSACRYVGTNEEAGAFGSADTLKSTFAAMGVNWPRGSSITYNSAVGKVFVANTAENLACFESLMLELNTMPKQVEIEAQFVRFERTNLVHLAPGPANPKMLIGLWTNGCGRVLAAPRLITRSGSEASVRGVTEVIYPTTFNTNGVGCAPTNAVPAVSEDVSAPCDFQTREVGSIFTVLPEVAPDGNLIHLTLAPSFVDSPTWRDYGYDVPAGAAGVRHVPAEQPFFHTFTYTSQISMADGATVLAGGGVPTQDGQGLVYCFLTVRLQGIDGEPLRKPDAVKPQDLSEF